MKLPPLNSIRAFEAAARHLSFKEAAEELFVTPAAISYQIKTLESYLGVRLFIRENRSILLTPAAQRCLIDIKEGFELIANGIEKAQANPYSGILNISAAPAFTIKWLAPKLHNFMELHPSIDARIIAGMKFVDLQNEHIDAAVRFGPMEDKNLYTEKLIEDSLLPLCSPSLLTGQYSLNNSSNIKHHTLIYDDSLKSFPAQPSWQDALNHGGINHQLGSQRCIRFNHAEHAIQAAIDGSGLLLGRRVLCTPDIQAGRLVCPFLNCEIPLNAVHYFACIKEKANHPTICAFLEWIKEQLKNTYQ